MNFVFERTPVVFDYTDYCQNFLSCKDTNSSGYPRFTISPMVSTLLRYKQTGQQFLNFNFSHVTYSKNSTDFEKYIIATGVAHSPNDWCNPNLKSIFHYLTETFLNDVKSGKALILLDQSHEGYHEDWMYDVLHTQCMEYGVNPKQIIYVTGNLEERNQYTVWADERKIKDKMFIVSYSHFETMIHETAKNRVRIENLPALPSATDHLEYKLKNITKIKTYNCLQKRPRPHRAWLFNELVKTDLLKDGINSMNDISHDNTYYNGKLMTEEEYAAMSAYLPMLPPTNRSTIEELSLFSNTDSGMYPAEFNVQVLLDTWLSVVSEASFGENTCFISEKTFKPIAASHPFIVYGNKYSLKNLQDIGYRTFHPMINEEYDKLDTWERLDAIVKELKRINAMSNEEKTQWLISMTDILKHNVEVLRKNSDDTLPNAIIEIDNYFRNYNVPTSN